MTELVYGLGIMVAGLTGLMIWLAARLLRLESSLIASQQALAGKTANDIGALCKGAVGADERLARLERRQRGLASRMKGYESDRDQEQGRPYDKAVDLVHKGASMEALVDQLGLSASEAELIYSLHHVDEAI